MERQILEDRTFGLYFTETTACCYYTSLSIRRSLVGLVDTPSEEMVVEERKVVWGDVEVSVDETDKHGVVDDVVVDTLEHDTGGLGGGSHVLASNLKRSVGDVKLTDPSDELRRR